MATAIAVDVSRAATIALRPYLYVKGIDPASRAFRFLCQGDTHTDAPLVLSTSWSTGKMQLSRMEPRSQLLP